MTPSQLKRSAIGVILLSLGACCHGRQIVYTDWEKDPTGGTQARACVDDTTARPRPGATGSAGYDVLAELTAADIRKENVRGEIVVTAYDAVEWLARWWFHDLSGDASGELSVYLDTNQRLGGKESLRDICATDVFLLRYMRSADAVARFGPEASGGAIVVTLR